MSIQEQIEEIKDEICRDLCKWPDIYDEDAEGCELSESEYCQNCPLNKL